MDVGGRGCCWVEQNFVHSTNVQSTGAAAKIFSSFKVNQSKGPVQRDAGAFHPQNSTKQQSQTRQLADFGSVLCASISSQFCSVLRQTVQQSSVRCRNRDCLTQFLQFGRFLQIILSLSSFLSSSSVLPLSSIKAFTLPKKDSTNL